MNQLSEEARAVTEAGKRGEAPTGADRERVRARLSAAIAAGAVGPALLDPTHPLRWWAGGKVASAGLAAAVVSGGALWWALQAPRPPEKSVVLPAPIVVAVAPPAIEEELAEPEEAEPVPTAAPAPRRTRTRLKTAPAPVVALEPKPAAVPVPVPAAAPAVVEDTLEAETRGLREVHQALRKEDPARALSLLEEQNTRFPRGQLREEREAAGVLARCAKSSEDGREALATFARQHPGSVLLTRLRKACEP